MAAIVDIVTRSKEMIVIMVKCLRNVVSRTGFLLKGQCEIKLNRGSSANEMMLTRKEVQEREGDVVPFSQLKKKKRLLVDNRKYSEEEENGDDEEEKEEKTTSRSLEDNERAFLKKMQKVQKMQKIQNCDKKGERGDKGVKNL
jgi:hypothetical protein